MGWIKMAPVHTPIYSFLIGFLPIAFFGAVTAWLIARDPGKPKHLLIGSTVAIGIYSLLMTLVGFAGGLKVPMLIMIGTSIVFYIWYVGYTRLGDFTRPKRVDWSSWKPTDIPTKILLWLLVIFQVVMFINALAPHVNQDADVSHYLFIKNYLESGQVTVSPENAFSYYPQALEMAVLTAYGRAGEMGPDAANLCFWFMQLLLIGWLIDFCVRRGKTRVGYLLATATCGLFYWPVIAYSGFVDGGVTLFSIAGLLTYFDWLERRDKPIEETPQPKSKGMLMFWRWRQAGLTQLTLVGFFLGTACASKYSALPTTILVLLHMILLLIAGKADRKQTWMAFLGAAVIFAIAVLPWYGRNIMLTGNPVFPFMRGIFGGPELTLADDVNTWSNWGIPITFTNWLTYPIRLSFFWPLGESWIKVPLPYINWLFVLSPIAGLLLLHRRLARIVAIWCVVFFTFAFMVMNVQTRYFLPFTILALWLVIEWLETFASQPVTSDLSTSGAVNPKAKSTIAKWVVLVIVLIPFITQVDLVRNHLQERSQYLVGGLTRDEYLATVWPSWEVFDEANRVATEDEKVMIFSLRTFYLDAAHVLPEPGEFDPSKEPVAMLSDLGSGDVKYLLMESRVRMGATILDWCVDRSDPGAETVTFLEGEIMDAMGEQGVPRELTREILKHRGGVRSVEDNVPTWQFPVESWRDPKIAGILDFLSSVTSMQAEGHLEGVRIYSEWELYEIKTGDVLRLAEITPRVCRVPSV